MVGYSRGKFFAVFPAYAGMSLELTDRAAPSGSFPRLRGDEPGAAADLPAPSEFSPPTRG